MAVVADGMTICEEKLKRLSAERYVPHECTNIVISFSFDYPFSVFIVFPTVSHIIIICFLLKLELVLLKRVVTQQPEKPNALAG